MHVFKDAEGVLWNVAINVAQLKAVRDLTGLDIYKLVGEGDLAPLQDPVNLCNVLFVLCRKQAAERNVTDEQFGERLYGDVIDGATAAAMEELVDFFPAKKRSVLREALKKQDRVQELIQEKAQREDRTPEEIVEEAWAKAAQQAGLKTPSATPSPPAGDGDDSSPTRSPPPPGLPSTSNGSSGSARARSPSTPTP